MDPDEYSRALAAEARSTGSETEWFDELYRASEQGRAVVPWDRGHAHPLLVDWVASLPVPAPGARALVVGSGPGYDAELLSRLGFATTAFDVSPTATAAARRRFPGSAVDYRTADLLDLPADWTHAFHLVVEIFTVQALPRSLRNGSRRPSPVPSLLAGPCSSSRSLPLRTTARGRRGR